MTLLRLLVLGHDVALLFERGSGLFNRRLARRLVRAGPGLHLLRERFGLLLLEVNRLVNLGTLLRGLFFGVGRLLQARLIFSLEAHGAFVRLGQRVLGFDSLVAGGLDTALVALQLLLARRLRLGLLVHHHVHLIQGLVHAIGIVGHL